MENKQVQELQDEELEIDLVELFHVVLKRWKYVVRCVLIGLVIGALYFTLALFYFPKYESTALLRVKSGKGGINFNPINAVMGGGDMAEQQVATYAEIMTSHSVIDPVLKHLAEDFPEDYPPDDPDKQPKYEGFLKSRINIEPVNTSDLLKVTTNAKTAEYAQKLTNYVLDSFQDKLIDLGRVEQRVLCKFLKERSRQAKEELNAAESKLRDFLAKNRYFSPDQRADIIGERLTRLDNQLAENEVAENVTRSRLKTLKEQLATAGVINVAASQATESIRNAITNLEVEKVLALHKYTGKHPHVQEIQNQIVDLKKKLNMEINKVVHLKAPSANGIHQSLIGSKLQAEAELIVIENKKKILATLSERNDQEIGKLPVLDQEFLLLKRDANLAGEIYVMLAKKYEESRIAEAMEVGDVQIIDYGTLPDKRTSPRLLKILFIFAFLGGFFSVGRLTLQFIFNATVNTEADVTKYLGLPVLGSIPEEKSLVEALKKDEKKALSKTFSLKMFNL